MRIRKKLEEWATLSLEEQERFCAPPTEIVEDEDGGDEYVRYFGNDPNWLFVGYVPMPKTRIAWFLYHLAHGLAMGYPIHKVLLFSLLNTKPKVYEKEKE